MDRGNAVTWIGENLEKCSDAEIKQVLGMVQKAVKPAPAKAEAPAKPAPAKAEAPAKPAPAKAEAPKADVKKPAKKSQK